jgi:hypothetical protein
MLGQILPWGRHLITQMGTRSVFVWHNKKEIAGWRDKFCYSKRNYDNHIDINMLNTDHAIPAVKINMHNPAPSIPTGPRKRE